MKTSLVLVGISSLTIACGNTSSGSNPSAGGGPAGGHAGAGGASGTAGAGGGGGSAGTGGTGGGGAGGMTDPGAHCEPATTLTAYASCSIDGFDQRLPNALDLFVNSVALTEPMVPGQPHAISFSGSITGGLEANTELWGASEQCGVAAELLWYGPATTKIHCAEFTPSAAHTHLLSTTRRVHDASNFSIQNRSFMSCASGRCPAGADGTGKTAAGPLDGPIGAYFWSRSGWYGGWQGKIGAFGFLMAVRAGAQDTVTPLAQGVFRMPATDPYGDAWYCFGAGSTATETREDELELSLQNITRLGDCSQTGSGAASIVTTRTSSVITSDVPGLPIGDGLNSSGACRGTELTCEWTHNSSPVFSWLRVTVDANLGTSSNPMPDVTGNVLASEWVVYRDEEGQPLGVYCGSGGTVVNGGFDSGTVEMQLEGVTNLLQCPGEPIANDRVTWVTY